MDLLMKILLRLYERACGGSLNYLGTDGSLPPPLEREEEARTVAEMERGSEEAKTKLIEHNLRLVVYIAKKFENTGLNLEDLISIGAIGLIKAVGSFSSERGIKLATYASRCIENEILMYLRKANRLRAEVSLDEPLNVDQDGNELLLSDVLGTEDDLVSRGMEEETDRRLLMEAVSELDERERRIIELRFGLNGGRCLTQKQVADMMGISQSYISRLEKRIMRRLCERLKRLEEM
ncbi:MAG: RNA polymerase sporulation sigma factor SigE [Clostridia bacterium]|jgi:RNA polymerase sporulation-specific sigma factor|nr:RNA polymerase sporulation sigma factor SigE [Clostridia bacterium]MBR3486090.1 RNA polymerase sporulation sigma factor SigE [Clostridia bacterium]